MEGHGHAFFLAFLLAFTATLGAAPPAGAALQKPTYNTGDRWVYDLRGSLDRFPGIDASEFGTFSFGLVGRVDVAIVGPDEVSMGGVPAPAVRVETRASGFLNGTFSSPGGGFPGSVSVTGSFSTSSTELWEAQAYLPVRSNGTSTYLATISYFASIEISASVRLNATTTYTSIPAFDLGVGDSATTPFTTDAVANTTITGFGDPISSENQTTVSEIWTREVLAETNVTAPAGTFSAHKVNQTLTGFPGLAGIVPTEAANETAYFSNSVGYYVKREASVNGTRVAELTLKSYTYPSGPSGFSPVDLALLVGIPAGALVAAVWLHRRRRKTKATETSGGDPGAR